MDGGHVMIEKVKIGCFTYEVVSVDIVNKFNPSKGEIDYIKKIIKLDETMTESDRRETILHEVIHGIDHFLEIELEEEQVRKIGRGLAMVLLDNPNLLKGDE